jgi:uncharacterized protein with gpF-like domain
MQLLPRGAGQSSRLAALARALRVQVRLERAAASVVARELRRTAAALPGTLEQQAVERVLSDHTLRMAAILPKIWNASMQTAGEIVLTNLQGLRTRRGAGAAPEAKKVSAEQRFAQGVAFWIEGNSAVRITRVTERTKQEVREIIAAGQRDNLTQQQISRQLRDSLGFSRARADMIARPEVHTATSAASDMAADEVGQENGGVLEREWISAEDDRTRSAHARANGQTRRFDERFEFSDDDGDYTLMMPGDPDGPARGVINCRCVLGYVPV